MGDGVVRTRVVIIDDQRMFLESLARLLSDESDIAVVGLASSGDEGIEMARRLSPDVVLVDHKMPGRDGVETVVAIRAADPTVMVVMLTGSTEDRVLAAAIGAGCSGFLTKDRAASDVAGAVRAAAAGEALISQDQLARLLPKLGRLSRSIGDDLTDRERELLGHLAGGATNKAIAETLYLSVNTVRNYVQSILTKLGAHSKLEAVSIAVRAGLVDYPTSR